MKAESSCQRHTIEANKSESSALTACKRHRYIISSRTHKTQPYACSQYFPRYFPRYFRIKGKQIWTKSSFATEKKNPYSQPFNLRTIRNVRVQYGCWHHSTRMRRKYLTMLLNYQKKKKLVLSVYRLIWTTGNRAICSFNPIECKSSVESFQYKNKLNAESDK